VVAADWRTAFPGLANLDAAGQARLAAAATRVALPPGAAAFRPGTACEAFVFVIAGRIRVQMVSETGREVVLYRVQPGETCILTTACLLGSSDYPAEAIAEEPVDAMLLPRPAFQALLDAAPAFRDFVFNSFGRRLMDLFSLVEEVAFRRVDLRLARFLLERRDAGNCVLLSHHKLAVELGTVREVVSRQLKEFERRAWVALHRGRIDVRDEAALRRLAAG
jgi:CRP/FNR family transcriptional regulator